MSNTTFYATLLSAAATLMGLLFFAVLFNVDRRGHRLGSHWLSLARSTINGYVMLALCPLVFLLPDLRDWTRSWMILVLAAFSIGRQFICWSSAWRRRYETSKQLAWRLGWLLLAPVATYVVVAYTAASQLWNGQPFRHDRVSVALLAVFIVALRNSWNLVLEHAGLTRAREPVSVVDTSLDGDAA
jgi:hypothetical protein